MSGETLTWLNENTLIGYTKKRGKAWHYREGSDNHYEGAVPVEDVRSRLFNWEAQKKPVYVNVGGEVVDGKKQPPKFQKVPGVTAIVRSDNHEVMGHFTDGYKPHQYGEWLIKNVETLLDDELHIGSAGLLKGGAIAWVSVEVPENIVTPEGVEFRPNLLACSSFNGQIASTYKRVVTNVVCDNTMTMALKEQSGTVKVRSTKHSVLHIPSAREALGIVYDVADQFQEMVRELAQIKVDDRTFEKYLDIVQPLADPDSSKRKQTMAENKRDRLWEMWTTDERVTPWRGTGFGVWQAMNTYNHHDAIVRNASRAERNQLNVVMDRTLTLDREALLPLLDLTA